MQIEVPVKKPRAKWLNDLLKSKRGGAHQSNSYPARVNAKTAWQKENLR